MSILAAICMLKVLKYRRWGTMVDMREDANVANIRRVLLQLRQSLDALLHSTLCE